MISYGGLFEYCSKIGCSYSTDVDMKSYTSFHIGGAADVMVFPENAIILSNVIRYITDNGLRYLVIGKGSNMLISDDGYRGVVINTSSLDSIVLFDETTIYCQSGISLAKLCRFALDNSLTGLEFAYGIPGSAGGAAYMNAGAYGGEMKDVLISCDHISSDGKIGKLNKNELDLSYRHSAYSDSDKVITSLTLKLEKGDPAQIKARMDELIKKRRDKQPLEYPSAGSTFKRPEGYFAGALIEQCGLKGYSYGDAQVSEKHAGFVINKGSAAADDVMLVIEHCRKTVFEKTGVTLEPEIKIIK